MRLTDFVCIKSYGGYDGKNQTRSSAVNFDFIEIEK